MNDASGYSCAVRAVEMLMLEKFRTEPFHNFHLLYGHQIQHALPGGTCSDKTLSFLDAAKRTGVEASLHSGFIGGKDIHRLAKINIKGRSFFADVGNGWPSVQLYPADREISYQCFGMTFRTEVSNSRVSVFHQKQGQESLQLEINIKSRPENEIKAEIDSRFNSGVVYPFSNSPRFSQVIGDRFLFLRGNRLEIYSDKNFEVIEALGEHGISNIISQHFGYELPSLV